MNYNRNIDLMVLSQARYSCNDSPHSLDNTMFPFTPMFQTIIKVRSFYFKNYVTDEASRQAINLKVQL